MSEQPDGEAIAAWFMERQRLLFEVIEGARYDLGEHVEALREVVADLKAGRIEEALELLDHEISSAEALVVALSAGGQS